MQETYDFNDVLIRPVPSTVSSRDDVDISVSLSDKLTLRFPLMAAPMEGVVDGKFAHMLSELGGLAFFHRRYASRSELFDDIDTYTLSTDNFGISIRIGEKNIEQYFGMSPKIILIDTANGYTEKLLRYCEQVRETIERENEDILLMAGNVVTPEGVGNLYSAGCHLVRFGIGGGSECSTRNVTGIGIPQISALIECQGMSGGILVADSGMKNSGDFVKAIVAGAHAGLAGYLYAHCYEAPNEGVLRGMASRKHMEKHGVKVKSVEGIDVHVTKKYSLADFVEEFGYGIKSAGTYLNAKNLNEIYINGKFVKVSDHAIKKGI